VAHSCVRLRQPSRAARLVPDTDSDVIAFKHRLPRGDCTHPLNETRRRPVDNPSRFTTAETKRRQIETGAAPVLARLPDVSADLPAARAAIKPAAPNLGYRFDPPEASDRGSQTAELGRPAESRTLKSELVYAPQASRALRPHVFDRARTTERPARVPRRESPILPRSNPFAIPRRGILDSILPALRFATLVALFAAAGTWIQHGRFSSQPANESVDSPTTAAEPAAPNTKTADQPVQAPTAVGPVGTTPKAATRVGRVRDNNDFATLRGDVLGAGVGDDPARSGDAARPSQPPEVAGVPGFRIHPPSR